MAPSERAAEARASLWKGAAVSDWGGVDRDDRIAAGPFPVLAGIGGALPPGRLGRAIERLSAVQRAVMLAEILSPPVSMRTPDDLLRPVFYNI